MWGSKDGEEKRENGSRCQDICAGEQDALARLHKPWYVILALAPPPECIVKPEPFQLASPLVNLVNFVSELGSLSFTHEQIPCSQKGTALQTQTSCGRKRRGRSLQTMQGLFLGKLKDCCLQIEIPHSSIPTFFKLRAAWKKTC